MIQFLLLLLGLAAIGTAIYVVGRLIYDIVAMFRDRASSDEGDTAVLWRDVKAIGIVAQLVALFAIIGAGTYLWGNFRARTDAIGLKLTFDFLDQPAGITIADNPLIAGDSVSSAIVAGFFNTIRVIMVGIPAALLLGTLVGIARFSSNWIVRKLATGYVEFFRNIPPLVVIVFVWSAVFLNGFPTAQEAWKPLGEWFILSNNRFAIPSIMGQDNFGAFRWILLGALLLAGAVGYWRTKVFDNTGAPHRRVLWAFATFLGIGLIAYLVLGGPVSMSKPMLDDRGRVFSDGFRIQMPFAALTVALVIYTGTHIAEIVRGSIMAVHKGQEEAANALALSTFQRYRFVVLPQAMRVAFPPLISQFLNFSKNSSLAIAIGATETTNIINNLFGQSQPAPQLILILALLYLALSLLLSTIGNLINRKLQIVGR